MLLEKLQADVILAMKEKNELRLITLRTLISQCKNKAIDKREALSEDEVMQVLKKEVKKRQEAIGLYQQGGRPELSDQEQKELVIIEEYLPKQLSAEELKPKVQEIIAEQNLAGQQFGAQMKAVMAALGNQADGSAVSQILKETK